jgi:phosphoglycolate phosphatase
VVFDLDGTLVDSLQDLAESANALLIECGRSPLSSDAIGRMVGDGAAALVRRAFAAAGGPQPPDALARFLTLYNARLLACTRPYRGIPDALAGLSTRSTLAVLTNKPIDATRQILAGLDLERHFQPEHVIGGDGPFPRKPDPAGLRELTRRTGADNARSVLVGDSVVDARTARAAGAAVCLARYGFGFRGFPQSELEAEDLVVDEPLDLLNLL